uniref:Large proline-rich protein BAG6 n=1 Tax=Megaselia scalaris TaxID=36166 RepID=T1GQJ6_MEGSC
MIIQLKVKTLDSRLYDFELDDEITILQFKDLIAEKTNIAANMQRIIYCGRVLLDDKKLKEYDVNGKVVHVVERLPPSTRPQSTSTNTNTSSTSGTGQRRENNPPFLRTLDGMSIAEALEGIFTNALRGQNVQNANVTLVELPVPPSSENNTANNSETTNNTDEPNTTQVDGEESSSSSTAAVAGSEEGVPNANEAGNDEPNVEEDPTDGTNGEGQRLRQRTRTQVLARVVEQMRNVQTRLAPFIDQYYEILSSDPNFEESIFAM